MPRKSVPSRSRGFGLRGRVMAVNSGGFCAQQTQLSTSRILPAAGFPAWAGTGSGPGASGCPFNREKLRYADPNPEKRDSDKIQTERGCQWWEEM
jgi:hypothetical protein